jgi:hypothetical protein
VRSSESNARKECQNALSESIVRKQPSFCARRIPRPNDVDTFSRGELFLWKVSAATMKVWATRSQGRLEYAMNRPLTFTALGTLIVLGKEARDDTPWANASSSRGGA